MDAEDWDERYREKPLLWSAGPNRWVEEYLAEVEPGSALDVACGEGRNAVWLADRGWDVTGVDFSPLALQRARQMAEERGVSVEWTKADVLAWDPGRTFELVLVAYVHLPPPERDALMEKVVSWVAPGGRLLLIGHDLSTIGVSGPSDPDLLWTPEIARRAAHPLRIVAVEIRHRPTEDGESAADTALHAVRAV